MCAGKLPIMETSSFNAPAAFIQEGDVGPLPRADATTLGAYLGNADLTALGDAAAAALAAAGEMSPSGRPSKHVVGAGQWAATHSVLLCSILPIASNGRSDGCRLWFHVRPFANHTCLYRCELSGRKVLQGKHAATPH
jgi:hypothetical protein